jgi:UDP-N-acetyl-alpha-D-muramoyl-L-alanyl-L-glutamate epimerase
MANERSASSGNVNWGGIDVNHQFSKSIRAERLMRAALEELGVGVDYFSVLRPASELAIAKAFTRLTSYHQAFSSCNTNFRLDGTVPSHRWCCDCPKCRFVFLVMAPFSEPERMREIFGRDMLEDESQFEGFALLTATGGMKPFECVGEEEESRVAMRMLAGDPRWRDHRVVRRLAEEVLPRFSADEGLPSEALALSDEHSVPADLMPSVRALLGP